MVHESGTETESPVKIQKPQAEPRRSLRKNSGGSAKKSSNPQEPKKEELKIEVVNDSVKDEEIAVLKTMVRRLNTELSRYQRNSEDIPEIPLEMRHLAPLVIAYDEEIREKDEIISQFDGQIETLHSECKNLVVENEHLHHKIEQFYDISKVDLDKHLFLKENAEIVLSENEALKEKIKNLQNQNSIEVQELSGRIREMKREVMTARNQVDEMQYVRGSNFMSKISRKFVYISNSLRFDELFLPKKSTLSVDEFFSSQKIDTFISQIFSPRKILGF